MASASIAVGRGNLCHQATQNQMARILIMQIRKSRPAIPA
jgi:hypothetical protein